MQLETSPFKHVVIDGFFPKALADKLADTFPAADSDWYKYDNVFEKKRAIDKRDKMPTVHAGVLAELNTHTFINDIQKAFEIPHLISDHTFRGGGLHQIVPGGKLDVHVDFNIHPDSGLDRRINAILYLNPNWESSWGGNLELWDKDMSACVKSIAPAHNRMVIFETTDFSFHGHPDPLKCPKFRTRNSMAWYFYSNGRPEHERNPKHSTMFQKRPQDETTNEIEEFRKKRSRGAKHDVQHSASE